MLSKNEINHIITLYNKKQRTQQGLFIVEGKKMVEELLQSSYQIVKIYATTLWKNSNPNTDCTIVSEDELKKISSLTTPHQVLAIAKIPEEKTIEVSPQNLTLILDGIQDPGNMGSIIRIADWFGIKQIICSHHTVDWYNTKVLQSTMGSFLRVNVYYTQLTTFLQNNQLPVYGALLNGENLYQTHLQPNGYLIIGNEGNGISQELLPFITNAISIPKFGQAESLNAAIATGIIVSHFKK